MQQAQINRSLINKTVDNFYAKFFRMENNAANILGRQVKSIERPNFTFRFVEVYHKGRMQSQNGGPIEFQAISIDFADDENSMVTKAIYEQVMRQSTVTPVEETSFEIKVECFNTQEQNIESFTLKECYIETVQHSQQIYEQSTDNVITVGIRFNNVDYVLPAYPA